MDAGFFRKFLVAVVNIKFLSKDFSLPIVSPPYRGGGV
jgi:hypothetical protein